MADQVDDRNRRLSFSQKLAVHELKISPPFLDGNIDLPTIEPNEDIHR